MLEKKLDQRLVDLFCTLADEHLPEDMTSLEMQKIDVIEALMASVQKCFIDPDFLQFFIKRNL